MIILVKSTDSLQKKINSNLVQLKSKQLTTIAISAGNYHEKIKLIGKNIKVIGLGKVKITYGAHATQLGNDHQPIGTFNTASFLCVGTNIEFNNISFENSSGFGKKIGQAVACYVHGDHITFEHCNFMGWQDTLLLGPLPAKDLKGNVMNTPITSMPKHNLYRYKFTNCILTGNVDFIFGGGSGLFTNCIIKTRPNESGSNYVAAPCTDQSSLYGFVFLNCIFEPTVDSKTCETFLGRPWRPNGKSFLIDCEIKKHVIKEGWSTWNGQKLQADFREYHTLPTPLERRPEIKIFSNTDSEIQKVLLHWTK